MSDGSDWFDRLQARGSIAKVGEGVYGEVFSAVDKRTGDLVALKRVKDLGPTEEGVPCSVIREIGLLSLLDHENVVRLVDVCHRNRMLYLVLEFVPEDLEGVVRKRKDAGRPITCEEACRIACQLLTGVGYCHDRHVLHRDVKPANVLVTHGGICKLCDFGISRADLVPCVQLSRDVVTLWYRAPELLLGASQYDGTVDVWSVGCVFVELLAGAPFFRGDSAVGQLMAIFQTLGTPTPASWPGCASLPYYAAVFPQWKPLSLSSVLKSDPVVSDLAAQLLVVDPKVRPTARRALQHRLFNCPAVA
ncbi:Cyclin-dependent kinase 1 [Diplonema papillatum]|nr:Cyclin-dependent kinase 1 [Diplonema papillatum]